MISKSYTLDELCIFIRNGKSVKQSKDVDGLPITRIETIANQTIDSDRVGYAGLTEEEGKSHLLECGDILFSHINSLEHLFKTAIYTGFPEKLVHGMNLLCIRPNPQLIFPQYLLHLLRSSRIRTSLLQFANKSVNQASISAGNLKSFVVNIPTLTEQRRIASILDQADELRQKRQQAIEKLDQLLQATFIDIFGDPVNNPKGWNVGCIGDMLESVKYGSSDKATLEGEIPILRMNNLTYSGEMDLRDLKYITKAQSDEKYLVKEGDILFNRTNSKELVGKTAVYVGPEPMAYAGYLVRGRTKGSCSPEYISAFLNSPWGKEKLQSMCKSIVGMANINAKEFQSIVLPIPPENEQMYFKTRVLAIREKKQLLVNQLNVFETLFKSLQNQAFSGTL
ncbi:restriction endonuclease subunit S [Acinetobacter bereziniae]|uniref:restriction endonuclease subunit S n=1 Tax=Acinetobacter bereziniae TaxID=106648 RepID=UPI002074D8E9|nr:restriction endonuclease subunit S [Acinetobacter bereziniae]